CGVLKPLGLSIDALAELAYQFARGGLDLVKDDQGLADHSFCPFEERVARCAEAVARRTEKPGAPVSTCRMSAGPGRRCAHGVCLQRRRVREACSSVRA
ncbi:MAG: hypothetical protein C4293_10800, partial [Nitrospiraceae bacterium]